MLMLDGSSGSGVLGSAGAAALGAQARAVSVARLSVAVGRMLLPLKPKKGVPLLATSDAIISIAGRNTNARTHLQLIKCTSKYIRLH